MQQFLSIDYLCLNDIIALSNKSLIASRDSLSPD